MPDRSVDGQDVQPAVVVEVEPGRAEARVRQAWKPDARTGGLFLEDAGSVVHVEIVSLTGELGDEQVFVAIVVEIARVHAHARPWLHRRRRALRRPSSAVFVKVPSRWLIHNWFGCAVIGDVDIDPAVAVEVGGRDAERRTELTFHARRGGDVSERPVAVVVIEVARLRAVHAGRTVIAEAADRVEARLVRLDAVVHVVPDKQIEPPVPVVIDERRRDAPPAILGTDFRVDTSVNVPSQSLRNSWLRSRLVTYRSTQPSLLKSPVAAPIAYPRTTRPLASVTSVKRSVRVPSG